MRPRWRDERDGHGLFSSLVPLERAQAGFGPWRRTFRRGKRGCASALEALMFVCCCCQRLPRMSGRHSTMGCRPQTGAPCGFGGQWSRLRSGLPRAARRGLPAWILVFLLPYLSVCQFEALTGTLLLPWHRPVAFSCLVVSLPLLKLVPRVCPAPGQPLLLLRRPSFACVAASLRGVPPLVRHQGPLEAAPFSSAPWLVSRLSGPPCLLERAFPPLGLPNRCFFAAALASLARRYALRVALFLLVDRWECVVTRSTRSWTRLVADRVRVSGSVHRGAGIASVKYLSRWF